MPNSDQAMVVASLLRQLAEQIERNPTLLENFTFDFAANNQNEKSKQEISPSFDIFEIYRFIGQEGLRLKLFECSLEELLATVKVNGLDSTGKVRKWKTPDKIIEFIVERVVAKTAKGNVFET